MKLLVVLFVATLIACAGQGPSAIADQPPFAEWTNVCTDWDDWDKPAPGFQVHANTYFVGTCGIGAVLITGSAGHVLIDGGTEAGASIISANIQALGFDIRDVKILLHSHEHFDHVAGLAALQRWSGAELYASTAAAPVLASGNSAASDPQSGMHAPFPAARVDQRVADGDQVRLGDIELTAVATPGHTAGALSWHWQACQAGDRAGHSDSDLDDNCERIVYADSLSPVSRADYRFSDHPSYMDAYHQGLDALSHLACTVLLTPHPSASAMPTRMRAGTLVNPSACSDYAAAVRRRLTSRLVKETATRDN